MILLNDIETLFSFGFHGPTRLDFLLQLWPHLLGGSFSAIPWILILLRVLFYSFYIPSQHGVTYSEAPNNISTLTTHKFIAWRISCLSFIPIYPFDCWTSPFGWFKGMQNSIDPKCVIFLPTPTSSPNLSPLFCSLYLQGFGVKYIWVWILMGPWIHLRLWASYLTLCASVSLSTKLR